MMEPENTNNNSVPDEENIPEDQPVEQFQDEPVANTPSTKDPMNWYPTPSTIKILVVMNLILAGAVGYIIYFAVDKERENSKTPASIPAAITPPPTTSPTKTTEPSASPSQSPSAAPSASPSAAPSPLPSVSPSAVPSILPSLAPSTPVPTPIFSESPTRGEFTCSLCGEGKDITDVTGEVAFGDRLTRTCAELQTDADNGDIVEEQCESLYSLVVEPCVCRSTETLDARTTASVRKLFGDAVNSTAIEFEGSNEDQAANFIFSDAYYTSVVDFATDDELIQRYLLVLASYETNIDSDLFELSGTWECEWDGITCSYGQIVGVNASKFYVLLFS
jgi:hypothetical protein